MEIAYTKPMKILVIEDDLKISAGITEGLRGHGYAVLTALDGESGEALAQTNQCDLVILDLMLPKKNGIDVCRSLRESGNTTPILMLTAKDTVEDKVAGLDAGVDDYLAKPFSFAELTARIRSLLRRPQVTTTDILELGSLLLDTHSGEVSANGRRIEITLREYGILEYLLRNPGKIITREELLEHVWDRNYDLLSNVVDVHVKNLRKKLPQAYAKRIETIRGKGYRIV